MQKKLITHRMFATFCELNSTDINSARQSRCPIIRSPGLVPIVANAHSVFAIACELNSPDISSARRSSCPIILFPGLVPIVANAHNVLECWQFVGLQNVACFAEQTPPVFVRPAPVIWEGSLAAFSGLGGKLWPH